MKIIIAALLAGAAVFAWGAVSWIVLLWHTGTIHDLTDGEPVVEMLGDRIESSGVYHYPGLGEEGDEAAIAERYRRGPNINLLVWSAEGTEPSSPWPFARGFALNFVAALLAASLLTRSSPVLPRFRDRVLFVTLLGGFAAVATRLADWNWGLLPLDFNLVMAIDLTVAWFLAGLVLAWRIPGRLPPSVAELA
jgi:hypothetical protein